MRGLFAELGAAADSPCGQGPTVIATLAAARAVAATVKQVVHDSAVQGVCSTWESPPGRRPARRLSELSRLYHTLSPADRQRLSEVVQYAVHSSIFGFLCVLDGVRATAHATGAFHYTGLKFLGLGGNRHPQHRDCGRQPDEKAWRK